MKIGVPKEIKPQENRIGLTPDSVKTLTSNGHEVLVENDGGFEAGFDNNQYKSAGAKIIDKAEDILKEAEVIENDSNQLINYTNIIKQNSMDVKKDIIEHLWKIIISDNTVDQYESNLMRRICGLIYFSDKECGEIKLKLMSGK